MSVLGFHNVSKRFGTTEVLRGVTLELNRHDVVCVIGASGSGKSTLLRCANLLERVDGGDVTLFGQSLLDPRIDENLVRRHIAMVFQSFNLFPHLSVLQNVMLGPVHALKRPTDEVRVDAMALLERITRTGTTVVMATHDKAMVDRMRRRVIELEKGEIVRDQVRGVYGLDEASL